MLTAEPSKQPIYSENEVRQTIARSLPFLEQGAVQWMQEKKCATCHHIPMMVWTHWEARRRGFAINEKAVKDLQNQARAQYLGHPDLTPTGQDTGFMEKTLGPGTVYLALAFQSALSPDEESDAALRRFRENFVARQNEDGSWTTKVDSPPLVDHGDSMTALILLAMNDRRLNAEGRRARERGVKWLKESTLRNETQPLALRVIVATQNQETDEVLHRMQQLRGRQQDDGGWSQVDGRTSDALATGEALYALRVAGVPFSDVVVKRAVGYLLSTQRQDGSWLVHTRNPNSHDPVISFVGTAWATLGLLQTLSETS